MINNFQKKAVQSIFQKNIGLNGVEAKNNNFIDVAYYIATDKQLYVSFTDVSNKSEPLFNYYRIDKKGNIDKDFKATAFNSVIDRINFFNSLTKINL